MSIFGNLSSLNNLRAGDLPPFNPRSITGNTLLLDASNSTVYQDGAVQFTTGDKAGLQIASNASLVAGGSFEIGGWFYPDSTNAADLVFKWGGNKNEYLLGITGTKFFLTVSTDGIVTGATVTATTYGNITAGQWYFVRARYSSIDQKLYISVNNGAENSVNYTDTIYSGDAPFKIGYIVSQGYFSGRMDSVYFTKTNSSTAEATALYNAGAGRRSIDCTTANGLGTFWTNVISWYDLGEENGVRYDSKGTNHLAQVFVDIISPTTLNGGFETRGTDGGLSSNVQTSTRARSSNVATIVTAAPHGLASTNKATITGMTDTTFNATNVTVTVTDATTFTYANTGSDVLSGADTGGRVTSTIFANWTVASGVTGTTTINVETSAPYAGSNALRIDVDAVPTYATCYQTALTQLHKYKATYYAKVSSSANVVLYFGGNAFTQAVTTSYALYTAYGTCTPGSNYVELVFAGASKSAYFDNITVTCTEIPSTAGIASGLAIDGNLCTLMNGTSQYLNRTSATSLVVGDFDFEFGTWVNFSSIPTSCDIITKAGGINSLEYHLYYTSNNFTFELSTDGSDASKKSAAATVAGAALPNVWYYVRCWHDSVNNLMGISVNGSSETPTAITGGAYVSTQTFRLGQTIGYGYFPGRMDATYKINRILTAGEITSMFNNGKGVKYAGLPSTVSSDASLVYWDLDEYSAGTGNVNRLDSTANAMTLASGGNTPSGQGVNYYEGSASKWLDQSASATNVIQTTQANRLMYVTNAQNGRPVLRGDGGTKTIANAADLIGVGNVTVFAVIKPRGLGGGSAGRIIDNAKFVLWLTSGLLNVVSDGSTVAQSAAASIALATAYVVIVTRTVTTGLVNFYINGTLSGTADQSSGTPAASTPTYIGNNSTGVRGWDGDIAEVGIYNTILTAVQISKLNAFLKTRWGV